MSIVVCGSCNVDLVMRCRRAPEAGETIAGFDDGFSTGVGGKGLNQAAACARQCRPSVPITGTPDAEAKEVGEGGKAGRAGVSMVACIGDDPYGQQCRSALAELAIDADAVSVAKDTANGVALITVESGTGDNRIVLSAGANAALTPERIDGARAKFEQAKVAVFQLEVPMQTVKHALRLAASVGNRTILNPAPAVELDDALLKDVHILIPNETEAGILSGVKVTDVVSAHAAAQKLLRRGVREAVIVTLGAQGCVIATHTDGHHDGGGVMHLPAEKVKAVDTTAAGDSFIGGLAAMLAEGESLQEAVRHGQRVAAITVTRKGALESIPTREEVI